MKKTMMSDTCVYCHSNKVRTNIVYHTKHVLEKIEKVCIALFLFFGLPFALRIYRGAFDINVNFFAMTIIVSLLFGFIFAIDESRENATPDCIITCRKCKRKAILDL